MPKESYFIISFNKQKHVFLYFFFLYLSCNLNDTRNISTKKEARGRNATALMLTAA